MNVAITTPGGGSFPILRFLLTDNPPSPGKVGYTTGVCVVYTVFEQWCGFFYVPSSYIHCLHESSNYDTWRKIIPYIRICPYG